LLSEVQLREELDVVGGAGFGLLLGTLARWAFGLGGEGLPPRPGIDPR